MGGKALKEKNVPGTQSEKHLYTCYVIIYIICMYSRGCLGSHVAGIPISFLFFNITFTFLPSS